MARDAWIIGGGVAALAAAHELSMQSHAVHLFSSECGADDGATHGYISMHGYNPTLDEIQERLEDTPTPWRPDYILIAEAVDAFTDYVYGVLTENNVESYQAFVREELEEMGPSVSFIGPEAMLRVMSNQTTVIHARWSVRSLLKGEDLVH